MTLLQQLSFDKQTEQQFRKYYFKKSSFIMKFSLILAIALYFIYGITDFIMLPLTKYTAWIIRFGIVIPILAIVLILSFTHIFFRWNQLIMTLLAYFLGTGIILMLAFSHESEAGHDFYFTGIMLVIMWIYTFSRIRFYNATGTALIITILYLLMEALVNKRFSLDITAPDTALLINNSVFFLSANIIGIFASFSIESYIRSDFLNRSEISRKESIIHENQEKLKDMILRVHDSSRQLEELSATMFSAAGKLTEGANSQASGIEHISTSVGKISETISNNLKNTEDTSSLARKTYDKSREGGDAVIDTLDSLKRIDENIKLINDIAFQTNILALNAAIESARAGTAGRGFSIVANEVKQLASTSHDAAAQITELVSSSVSVGEKTGKLFQEILPDIETTADLIQKIAHATSEQSVSLKEIQERMKDLSTVAQKTSSLADAIQTTSDALKDNAARMASLVDSMDNQNILELTDSSNLN